MTKLILAALALATAHYAQTVEPLTGSTYTGDRAKINRNLNALAGASSAASTRCVSASSSATAYTCALAPAITTCATDMRILWTPDVTSGATPTLNAGCGAKALKTNEDVAVATSQFAANVPVELRYDGTAWRAPAVIPGSAGGAVTGTLSVGTTNPAIEALVLGSNALSVINKTIVTARAISGADVFHDMYRDESTFTSTGTGAYASYDSQPTFSGTINYNHFHGFQARGIYSGSGTVGTFAGFTFSPAINGPATNVFGVRISPPTGVGAINNLVGFSCDDFAVRGTANYCVYSNGSAPSFFGGSLQTGGSVTANSGTVQGNIVKSNTNSEAGTFFNVGGFLLHGTNGLYYANTTAAQILINNTAEAGGARTVSISSGDGATKLGGAINLSVDGAERARVMADGGIAIRTGTKPTCDAAHRGVLYYVAGATDVADTFEACRKDASNVYAWASLF